MRSTRLLQAVAWRKSLMQARHQLGAYVSLERIDLLRNGLSAIRIFRTMTTYGADDDSIFTSIGEHLA